MTDTPPETNDDGTPKKRDTSVEDAENKARRELLFGDLEEEETPEEIKAERDGLWQKLTEMAARLDSAQKDKSLLVQKLLAQKEEAAQALAKIQKQTNEQKAAAIEIFVKEITLVVDNLKEALGALPHEMRAADPKFDKLAQGVEKTVGQLTAVFNKFAAKESNSKAPAMSNTEKTAETAAETVADGAQKNNEPDERIIRENETPGEILAERDALRSKVAEMAGKIGKSQQDALTLTRHLNAQKTESEQALARIQNQLNEQKSFALEKFVKEILPVVDNLERGLTVIPQAQRDADAKFAALAQGVEKTLGQLTAVFGKFGIKEINPKGETFDPERHEAISTDDSVDAEPETVVGVAQKGYELNERVIRHAKVIVKP